VSPTSAIHVEEQLKDRIDYVLDGGDCVVGVESTIVSFLEVKPIILREGGVSREEIEKIIGEVATVPVSSSKPLAPGMLESHYAPRVKLTLVQNLKEYLVDNNIIEGSGLLCFKDPISHKGSVRCVVLSQKGNVEEAASNLFRVLRSFDSNRVSHIYAEMVPNKGIGRAVNDRLQRASAV
jgi:L-threonylcarbamoyladenylate synthase